MYFSLSLLSTLSDDSCDQMSVNKIIDNNNNKYFITINRLNTHTRLEFQLISTRSNLYTFIYSHLIVISLSLSLNVCLAVDDDPNSLSAVCIFSLLNTLQRSKNTLITLWLIFFFYSLFNNHLPRCLH